MEELIMTQLYLYLCIHHTLFPHLDYQVKDILGYYLTIFFGSHHQNLSALRGEGSVGVATIARSYMYLSCNSGDRLKASSDSNSGRSLRSYGHSAGSYLNGGVVSEWSFYIGVVSEWGFVSEWSFYIGVVSEWGGGGGL